MRALDSPGGGGAIRANSTTDAHGGGGMAELPKLTKRQIGALKSMSINEGRFEPVQLREAVSQETADQLVELGLVERGDCYPRYAHWGYLIGYRLTPSGREFLLGDRSRYRDQIPL